MFVNISNPNIRDICELTSVVVYQCSKQKKHRTKPVQKGFKVKTDFVISQEFLKHYGKMQDLQAVPH